MRFPLHSERFSARSSRRRPVRLAAVACLSLAGAAVCAGATPAAAQPSAAAVPHLDHVFVIVEENNGFHDVIGNPAAPNLNSLARNSGSPPTTSGSATLASPTMWACSAATPMV